MTFRFRKFGGMQMSRFSLLPWAAAVCSMTALTVSAQSAPQASPSRNEAAQASGGDFRTTLEGYQPFTEEKTVPWKQVNDTVGQIGGWRAYAKEAQDAAAKDEQAPTSSSPASGQAKKQGPP